MYTLLILVGTQVPMFLTRNHYPSCRPIKYFVLCVQINVVRLDPENIIQL